MTCCGRCGSTISPLRRFPSPADGLYLLMYPCMYIALMAMMRSRMRDAATAQWLDGAVLTLAVGAIAATLVSATSVATGGRFIDESVTVAYPVLDCILLMLVIVAYTLMGWRPGANLLVLGVAIILMAGADIMFVENVAGGIYVDGTLLNVLYLSSFSLFAVAAWIRPGQDPARDPRGAAHDLADARRRVVVAGAARAGGVRARRSRSRWRWPRARSCWRRCDRCSPISRTSGSCAPRAREATTDVLTGLSNRRQLIVDLERSGAAWASRGSAHAGVLRPQRLQALQRHLRASRR